MFKHFVLIFSFLYLSTFSFSQSGNGMCGTSTEDQAIIKQRMIENREYAQTHGLSITGAPKYVPVTFHLYAKRDGTGRLPVRSALENLCALNKLYADQEIIFYIKEIRLTNNDDVYNDPSSSLGQARITAVMNGGKKSLNIFVASKANGANLGVLAYYSPQGDYIVADMKYVNAAEVTTLGHEIGHFFSLAHTFYGWENTVHADITMNCLKPTPTIVYLDGVSQGPVYVEYTDQNKLINNQKQCLVAADGFCDTPADYNFGFGWQGGCTWSGCAKDPDGAAVNPTEKNIMGYFLNCLTEFSPDQKTAIATDYASLARGYLRTAYSPKQNVGTVNYVLPVDKEIVSGYDMVQLKWDPVANADAYVVELAENIGFVNSYRQFITTKTDTTILNLNPNRQQYWRVIPYNSSSFCTIPAFKSFKTPSYKVANQDIKDENFHVSTKSLLDRGIQFIFNANQSMHGNFKLVNLSGLTVYNSSLTIAQGLSTEDIYDLPKGIYIYQFVANDTKVMYQGKIMNY